MSKAIYPSLKEKPALVSGGARRESAKRLCGVSERRARASASLIYWKKLVHRSPGSFKV